MKPDFLISTTQDSMKFMLRVLFAFPIKLCHVAGIDYAVGCGRWWGLHYSSSFLEIFHFMSFIQWSQSVAIRNSSIECVRIFYHLLILNRIGATWMASQVIFFIRIVNIWFCISCSAWHLTYFDIPKLTFFSTISFSLFAAIN